MKKKLLFVTSIFPSYRNYLIEELSTHYDVTIAASIPDKKTGFMTPNFRDSNIVFKTTKYFSFYNIFYQSNLISITKKCNPNIIIISSSVRDIGYWLLLFYTFFTNIKVISHGQGPFNKKKNFFNQLQYYFIQVFSYRLVIYTIYSLKCLKDLKIPVNKTRVIENTILNKFPISSKDNLENNKSILFIGRLRKGSDLDILIDSVINLKPKYPEIECHIIGGGELENHYRSKYKNESNIFWYGKLYSDSKIAEISKRCSIACYPGNTGLSVVHFLSLSLPVIIHNKIKNHQGPEASYIQESYNGLLFDFKNQNSLQATIEGLINDVDLKKKLSQNAYNTYENLSMPSYASKFVKLIENDD